MSADLVIAGGRLIDPLSGFDAVADVAVAGGRIAGIGVGLEAKQRLDAEGLVVAPGFIDLHSHVHSIAGHRLQAHDGVTTALDLEAGASPVSLAYAEAARDGRPLNYGFSASWSALRMEVLAGLPADGSAFTLLHHLGNPGWQRAASRPERDRLVGVLERELAEGALGVGVLVGYAPGTGPDEYLAVAAAAARAGRPVFTHARELVEADPEVLVDGPTEIVRAAAETGAHMHYCHINSTSRRHIDRVLGLVERCRAEGGRVTTEAYPYGSGSTAIGAAFLDPQLLPRWGLTPNSIIYLPTGERVADAARLRELRAHDPGGLAIIELLREDDAADRDLLDRGVLGPDTMVASDAMPLLHDGQPVDDSAWPLPPGTVTHPRTAGTFARTLRRYVREDGTMDLTEAIRRSATLPALALQDMSPAMRRKGRLQLDADADIVAFDLATVTDQATYAESCRVSAGIRHVLVNGVPLISDGLLDTTVLPGRPVRAA
jgi:cytosine/adenosine deaminase-related metal-dependent hydrolase